jgi:ATP-dependent Clp protease ATP-binding subunit ClpX
MDKVIERRIGRKEMGFGANIQSKEKKDIGEVLALAEPEDLLKYGLIPELVGRMPVMASLNSLDQEAMIEILTRPKNAITKQYKKFFEMEGVDLQFTDGALAAIAQVAMDRGTGARGLRAVIEESMLDIMYDVPSQEGVESVEVTEDVILKKAPPLITWNREKKKKGA